MMTLRGVEEELSLIKSAINKNLAFKSLLRLSTSEMSEFLMNYLNSDSFKNLLFDDVQGIAKASQDKSQLIIF